uniref:Methyltransferase type 12 n=1 Tax=Thermosporothrix sp. COM3 TaxID=2490863 RepID=A0A455SH17_9CHLR|nr:methyltransferase type 12 [Thermosporothrix sp. COM3]
MAEEVRVRARRLAQEYIQRGDVTGWFEVLYAAAEGNEQAIQWADMVPNPGLLEWLEREEVHGEGRRALVVGCGLGDDAEELARRGFEVTAFDISPTAIEWCQRRFPDSRVTYVVADALKLPEGWQRRFDFLFEAYTLQVLPPEARQTAARNLASCLAEGGILLVICRGRSPEDPEGDMPWPLTAGELQVFLEAGLSETQFEEYFEESSVRRFRVTYSR